MKILYILDWSGDPRSGVPKKVCDQITEWKRQNHQVRFFVACPMIHKQTWDSLGGETFAYKNIIGRMLVRFVLLPLRVLMIHTDVLYSRYGLFTPLELIVLSVKSSALEINAELANFYKKRNWLLHTIYLLQRQIIKRAVKLFIHVTKESLDKSAEPRNSVFVTNGIDLTRFIQLPRLNTEDQKINLIFVGSADFPWNGFEKLELIANSLPNIEITTVGINSSSHPRIKSLPSLYANDLQELFILMDAAISTLDIQIMGIVEAAPLKTRHYLASGLPVIGGYIDSAYPNGADFYFKINFSTDMTRILNLDEMNRFLSRWKMRRVNAFNLAEIDIRMTEKTRLQYLRRIMQT